MSNTELKAWLKGYLYGKTSLTEEEIKIILNMINSAYDNISYVPYVQPYTIPCVQPWTSEPTIITYTNGK